MFAAKLSFKLGHYYAPPLLEGDRFLKKKQIVGIAETLILLVQNYSHI